ncbi:MAG TPA: glycogen debranching N-terminal domain-containing protein [Actinomycetes bacterium]|nr:glycogen debranching N-terminal domain-containing protein [Actinomycetes bacterium]
MVDAWTLEAAQTATGPGTVTLVEGSSFCVCAQSGDIGPGGAQGVYFRDTRLLSSWQLHIDTEPVEPLLVIPAEPFRATFVGRARPRPGKADSTLLVNRQRYVGTGMREDITLVNLATEAAGCTVAITVDSDMADLFEVKAGRLSERGQLAVTTAEDLVINCQFGDQSRGVRVSAPDGLPASGQLLFRVVVPPRSSWHTTIQVHPIIDGEEPPTRYPGEQPFETTVPAQRLRDWQRSSPVVATSHAGLAQALYRSREDLGALRIFDPNHPDRPPTVAAGAPWFMTLFGRDSLLTSWMALPLDQSLALGTLATLAELQGTVEDPLTEEEPGKILHELRFGVEAGRALGGGSAYYGSVDSTPLFVMLLGELRRWGLHRNEVEALLPHADRALQWIERYGDADGDGFVEYRRKTDRGLANQGWKDSSDGINFADGRLAEAPIALAEVQGYVYSAYLARSHFATEAGDRDLADHWASKAAALKQAFNETFWLPDRGYFAVGLDRDKRPIDALASNMGHCLWTGIVDVEKAGPVARRLMSDEMYSGWGVRTLATTMGAYNPMSYHNGSVWPHDNAVVASGLMRYGFTEDAQRLAESLLDAAGAYGGRLPELFCGFDRAEYPQPVPYPTSCSPQAWAAASPVHLLRVLLRLDPWVPYGRVWLAPALPTHFGDLRVSKLPLAGSRLSISVQDGAVRVRGLPEGIELVMEPRNPLTAAKEG